MCEGVTSQPIFERSPSYLALNNGGQKYSRSEDEIEGLKMKNCLAKCVLWIYSFVLSKKDYMKIWPKRHFRSRTLVVYIFNQFNSEKKNGKFNFINISNKVYHLSDLAACKNSTIHLLK